MTHMLGVESEVGQLRRAIVHRPGLELTRLTPRNCDELLCDDVLWADKAREEHDTFTQALAVPEAKAFVLDRVCSVSRVGPTLMASVRAMAEDVDAQALADLLIGGITKSDLSPLRAGSLRWQTLALDDFILTPVPNTLFQRDNSAWVYGGVSINPMAKAARRRESIHSRAVYRYHPLFAG